MKTKKIVSLILAIVMVVGLLPMSAIAQSGVLATVTGNTYTDKTADPNKNYQYTVTGSDGSTQVLTVPSKNFKTGNTMKEIPMYYKRVAKPELLRGTHNRMLLVTNKDYAVQTDRYLLQVRPVADDRIEGNLINCEWQITQDDGYHASFRVNSDTSKAISIGSSKKNNNWLSIGKDVSYFEINYNSKHGSTHNIVEGYLKFAIYLNPTAGVWNHGWRFMSLVKDSNGKDLIGATFENQESATQYKYYEKIIDADQERIFEVDATDLENFIKVCEQVKYVDVNGYYTNESRDNFIAALEAAKTAVNNNKAKKHVYLTADEANRVLGDINQKHTHLKNMLDALTIDPQPGTCIMPEIEWNRTFDPKDTKYYGDVTTNVQVNMANNYHDISWDWNAIKNTPVGPQTGTGKVTRVWDYNTGDQVTNVSKYGGVSAATWYDVGPGKWPNSSVRRFSGTFTWPEGYDLNDKAQIFSANDANYKEIYDFINNNPKLKARYGNSKVFAVNDNMYVFISKADEQPKDWTQTEAMDRLAFWTGTDGKGKWTKDGSADDWSRTTPAVFNKFKAATPAFHNGYPNNGDVDGDYTSHYVSKDLQHKMTHSDGWYSLVDSSSTIMSTLKNVYGATEKLGGQKMRIEVFAFDNDSTGGMDELKLKICKPSKDDIPVTVKYWLGSVGGKDLGFTTYFTTGVAPINLVAGTNVNNLNYKKAAAVAAAPANAKVQDGVQQEPNFIAKKGQNNVINVVYPASLAGIKYLTYDFATNNILHYTDESSSALKSVSITGPVHASASINADNPHIADVTYKPVDGMGTVEAAKLTVNRQDGTSNTYDINIIPASNVLYEENYFKTPAGTRAAWSKTDAANVTVSDNDSSVFGFTGEYANRLGANGEYKATVKPQGAERFTNDLKFSFRGQGFDLMAQCGANTGTLMVTVRDRTNQEVIKNYMVNTAINDSSLNTLYQVPVIHETELGAGEYDVIIKGANVAYGKAQARMAYSMKNSAGTANNAAYNAMVEMGFTAEEIANTEFININDMVATSSYALRNAPQTRAAAATNLVVAIDSIRVYRSSAVPKDGIYPKDEMNVKYTNVLSATNSQFTAYMEGMANGAFGVKDYRTQGGPADEIYLKAGTAIAIAVPAGVTKTHVSLRAVKQGTVAQINTGKFVPVNHSTEMYYEATVEDGMIIISNRGQSMLAVANVKCAITEITDTQLPAAQAKAARMMSMPIRGIFNPERFDVKLDVIKGLFNNYATLKIKTSQDVAYITVNGVRVDANNINLQKWGMHDYMRFAVRKTFKKNDAILFEVVAYDKNGNASDPITKK